MSHRINIMVDDRIWQSLQRIPKGERSQLINIAISEKLLATNRIKARNKMDEIREQLKPLDDKTDVMELLRQDRMREA